MVFGSNLLWRFVALDVGLQNRIEHLVEVVRNPYPSVPGEALPRVVFAGWPEMTARSRFEIAAELVDLRLDHISNDGERTHHVSVERAIPYRHLRFVAGSEHQRAELVGKRHQQVAAYARLDVLLGDVGLAAGEAGRQGLGVLVEKIMDGNRGVADAQVFRQCARIVDGAGRGVRAGHANGGYASLPRASTAMAATSAESTPPLSATNTLEKPHLRT